MKIGIILRWRRMDRAARHHETSLKAAARQSETLGFDSVWVYDHLLHRFEGHPTVGFWEAWTMLTALAAVTERVELGTTVLAAGFRNPALLAKMADTLDEVSGGRLILGLGAGWHEPEFDAFGFPFDHRVSRLEEALQIIKRSAGAAGKFPGCVPPRGGLRDPATRAAGGGRADPDCRVRPAHDAPRRALR